MDYSVLSNELRILNDFRKIRNKIVHDNGKFYITETQIFSIIKHDKNLGVRFEEDIEILTPENEYEIEILETDYWFVNARNIRDLMSNFAKQIISQVNKDKILKNSKNSCD